MAGLTPISEEVAGSACRLFILWLLGCVCLSFPLVLGSWCGSNRISSGVHLFIFLNRGH